MDEVDLPEHARDPNTGLRRLAPEIEAARDKIVDHFEDKPFAELKAFVQQLLEIEEDETKRLGALAARVYLLRKRIIDFEETVELVPAEEARSDRGILGDAGSSNKWARVRVLENCEVNGMRLPEGIIVDVSADDAQRLIDSGHAELRRAAEPELDKDMLSAFGDAPNDNTTGELADEITADVVEDSTDAIEDDAEDAVEDKAESETQLEAGQYADENPDPDAEADLDAEADIDAEADPDAEADLDA
ncbi:MAG: hypothetical protein CBC43_003180, partial [Rhizobiales bacterium TMED83]